jgi:hypothetical protein
VILAHRLLKNGVPRKADYVLVTRPALRYMDVDPGRAGLSPHIERYEHFGDVECWSIQRPRKTGARFSKKARRASLASSVANARRMLASS